MKSTSHSIVFKQSTNGLSKMNYLKTVSTSNSATDYKKITSQTKDCFTDCNYATLLFKTCRGNNVCFRYSG